MVNKTVHGDSYEYEYKYETQTTSGRDIRTPFERRYGSSTQFTAAGIGFVTLIRMRKHAYILRNLSGEMSEEESSSSDSEASDNVDDTRNLPEGAPRISSCALIEDGEEEHLRYNISRQNLQSLQK